MENIKKVTFMCEEYQNEETLTRVSELNSIFEDLGIFINVCNRKYYDREFSFIEIKCDTNKIDNFRSRGAGRKKAKTNNIYFADQVREMMKTKTADEVAKSMGISRTTLFRRLKHADETGNENI